MRKLLAIFIRNWGLKLLALVLALVVYYSLRDNSVSGTRKPGLFLKGTDSGSVR